MSTTSQLHVTPPPSSPSRDRGGPAQPLLIVNNLRKYFPVRGDFRDPRPRRSRRDC
jgi:hypothetical protein